MSECCDFDGQKSKGVIHMRAFVMIVMVALMTLMLRAFPFVLFSGKKQLPDLMVRLEKQLPCAVMVLLVVYCIKGVSFSNTSSWVSTFAGVAVTALVHLKKKNVLLSILAGTLVYMMFVQFVF